MSSFQIAGGLSDADWVDFLTGSRPEALDGLQPPIVPEPRVQEAYVGSSRDSAMREAGAFYSPDPGDLGRTACFRADDRPCSRLRMRVGTNQSFLPQTLPTWGPGRRRHRREMYRLLPRGDAVLHVLQVRIETAAPLRSGLFRNVVVAYSVFSHLAEDAFRAWLAEFSRLVKPGGFLFFTTLKIEHLTVWAELAMGGNEHYKRLLAATEFSLAEWQRRAAFGDLLFVPTGRWRCP